MIIKNYIIYIYFYIIIIYIYIIILYFYISIYFMVWFILIYKIKYYNKYFININ